MRPIAHREPSRHRLIAAWALQALLAAIFFATGAGTLAEVPAVADSVDQVGLGSCFRILVGVAELVGAAAISLPDVAVLGALWLVMAMSFAVLTHLYVLQDSPLRSLVLLLACALVVVLRREQLAVLRTRLL